MDRPEINITPHRITLGIQIVPIHPTRDSYQLIDAAIDVISHSGIRHQVTPFETVMEGTYDQLMTIAREAQLAAIRAGADECLVYYRIHYRQNRDVTFEEKTLAR